VTEQLITTDELIERRMVETGLTKEQLLLVVAKSALVRHIATGPDSDRFVLKGGTLLAHVYGSPRESVRDADYTYVDPELPTVPDLVEMLTIDGKQGFYLDAGAARWKTERDIYEAKRMPFSIERVAFERTRRGRALDISMTVRSGECLDGPKALIYMDTMLATTSRFEVAGLTLEELTAEKILAWASKDLSKHFIDLAYIAREHADRLDLDHIRALVHEKFAAERHQHRYRATPTMQDLTRRFSDPDRVELIRRRWDEAIGTTILFLPSEDDRSGSLTAFTNVMRYVEEVWLPVLADRAR
jgi:predicted nucleotidyltransferase component of viral defense system